MILAESMGYLTTGAWWLAVLPGAVLVACVLLLDALGSSLPPDEPAIGVILAESMGYLTTGAWWLAVLPGAVLVACVLLLDALGSSLRRVLDARTSQE